MANDAKNVTAAHSQKCTFGQKAPAMWVRGSSSTHSASNATHVRMMRLVVRFFRRIFRVPMTSRITAMKESATSMLPSVNIPSSVWV